MKNTKRLMYIECKGESDALEGDARIGWVRFSKTGKTIYYRGLAFQSLKGLGFKANYYEIESGDYYWISGPKKDLNDRLYGGNLGVIVDEDAQEAYQEYVQGKRV